MKNEGRESEVRIRVIKRRLNQTGERRGIRGETELRDRNKKTMGRK